MRKKVCMVVPSFTAKGGITSVVNGYRNSQLTEDYDVRFIETYCDGSAIQKTSKALSAYLKFIYTVFFLETKSCSCSYFFWRKFL